MKARMMERKAVIYQNWCQSHVAGKMLPIVPKPPSCLAPSFEKRYFMFPTYPFRVFTPRETPAGKDSKKVYSFFTIGSRRSVTRQAVTPIR